MTEKEKRITFWLGTVPGIGILKAKKLVEKAGGPDSLYRMSEEEIKNLSVLHDKERIQLIKSRQEEELIKRYEELKKKGIQYISYFDDEYPDKLKALANPPLRLYVKGQLPDSSKRSIGIVGARECTPYGRDMARMFGFRLAKAGVQVISGMARGIDGWAHQGALESGGKTFAILGSGVDVCYPAAHCRLYESIGRRGGILSEYHPGTTAKPQFFPLRNRIISGFSDGILLVEARKESGSLITVEAALEQGRDVFVIPGRIGDELSVGCNRLIVQGAVPVLSADDILEYYGLKDEKEPEEENSVHCLERALYERLQAGMVHVDVLCAETGASATEVMKTLVKLKNSGKAVEISRGNFTAI